jgi:hypothetical protein
VFREEEARNRITFVHHKVMGIADSLDKIQEFEEKYVAGHWEDERLLNMIPGGKAGVAYLHRHQILNRKAAPQPDEIEAAQEKQPLPLALAMEPQESNPARLPCEACPLGKRARRWDTRHPQTTLRAYTGCLRPHKAFRLHGRTEFPALLLLT